MGCVEAASQINRSRTKIPILVVGGWERKEEKKSQFIGILNKDTNQNFAHARDEIVCEHST